MNLSLSKNLSLPTAYVTGKAALLGRTGSGKTNTGVVLAEQMLERGYPLAILDPQGDWWGLRSKYKIVIMGGEHGDIPLEPTAGELAADFMVDNRVPVLFDLFKMGEGEMVRFATDFARRLWTKNRDALHIFLDEADLFAPQRDAKGPKAQCLGAWQNIVRRGRSRGIGCTMITQRSAVINKDLLTQADPLIVHRLTAPQDLAAVEAYLDVHGVGREMTKSILADVAGYKLGEGIVISPGTLGIPPTNIKVPHRKSFDSSATPEVGKAAAQPKDLASIDLDALSKQFSATIEKAKADDPKLLRQEIVKLKAEIGKKPATAVDPATIQSAVNQAIVAQQASQKAIARDLQFHFDRFADAFTDLETAVKRTVGELSKGPATSPIHPRGEKPITKPVIQNPVPRPKTDYQPGKQNSGDLPRGEAAVLSALIQYPNGLRAEQLTVLTGYKRSSRDAYLQRLRERGYVSRQGDLHVATAEGQAALPDAEPLPTGPDLKQFWLSRLPEGERKILEQLISAFPSPLRREALDEMTGYKRSSRDAYLQRLKAKELVETSPYGVYASATLF